jgi:hypothetical protein
MNTFFQTPRFRGRRNEQIPMFAHHRKVLFPLAAVSIEYKDETISFDRRILASIAVKGLHPIAKVVIRSDEPTAPAIITP